jgi:hypothetical protein
LIGNPVSYPEEFDIGTYFTDLSHDLVSQIETRAARDRRQRDTWIQAQMDKCDVGSGDARQDVANPYPAFAR